MAYTSQQLITQAYNVSGVVSQDLEYPTGSQITQGLLLFNQVLSFENVTARTVPYFTYYTFNAVIGQETYFIPNLIEVEVLTFLLDTFRYSTQRKSRRRYWGDPRAQNVNSLPLEWEMERVTGGANINLYFFPNIAYPISFMGKFGLSSAQLEDDLTLIYDNFYIDYLTYRLGERIAGAFQITFPPVNQKLLDMYEQQLRDVSGYDFSVIKTSTLKRREAFSFAQANIGRGYTQA
jgi:hypothetical protein